MSPALAACAKCGHRFAEQEMLDPCPECSSTERTLQHEELVVDRSDPGQSTTARRIEEREPDGSTEIVEQPIEPG